MINLSVNDDFLVPSRKTKRKKNIDTNKIFKNKYENTMIKKNENELKKTDDFIMKNGRRKNNSGNKNNNNHRKNWNKRNKNMNKNDDSREFKHNNKSIVFKNNNKIAIKIELEKNVNLEDENLYRNVVKRILDKKINKILRRNIEDKDYRICGDEDIILNKVYTVYLDHEKLNKSRKKFILERILDMNRKKIIKKLNDINFKTKILGKYNLMGFLYSDSTKIKIMNQIFGDREFLECLPFVVNDIELLESNVDFENLCLNLMMKNFSVKEKIMISKKNNKIIRYGYDKIKDKCLWYNKMTKSEKRVIKRVNNICFKTFENNSEILSLIKKKNKNFFEKIVEREIMSQINIQFEIDKKLSNKIYKTTQIKTHDVRNSKYLNITERTSMFQNRSNIEHFLDFRQNDLDDFKEMHMVLDYIIKYDGDNFKTFYRNMKKYYIMDLILIKKKHNIEKSVQPFVYYENLLNVWMKKHKMIINTIGLLHDDIQYDLNFI